MASVLAVSAAAGVHPRAGTTSMAFLKIGAGARYTALGDAGAALADDAFACFWNPARLSEMYGKHSVCFQHNSWIAGTSVDEAYYALCWGKHRFGLSSRLLATDDIPMRGEIPNDQPVAYFRAYDFFAGFSYAFVPNRHLSAGISYRRLYEKIYLEAAYGHSLQAGLNLNLIDPEVSITANADNVGTRINYSGAYYYKQPTSFSLGVSWRLPWEYQQIRSQAAAAAAKSIDDSWQGRLGAELVWRGMLALRLGYKSGHSTEGLTAGTGLAWRQYKFDYAFVPHRYDLGTSHRFSLGLGF
jgi:hypothetical protein